MKIADGIRRKYAEAMEPIGKGDLYIADHKKVDERSAKLLVAFKGDATRDDIEQYVLRVFAGKLVPVSTTLRFHPAEKAASLVVRSMSASRPLADSKKMARLTPGLYVDTQQNKWKVEERDGNKYLLREADEDIENLLNERKKRMLIQGSSTPRFATLTEGHIHVDVGDVVKYYHEGTERVGTVVSLDKGRMKIKRPAGYHEVEIIAATSIMEKSAELDTTAKKKLYDYYVEAFGDADYAKQLVYGPGGN